MDDEAAEKAWERYYEFAPLMPDEHAAYLAGARWAREEALREAADAVARTEPANLTSYYGIQDWTRARAAAEQAIRALADGGA